MKKIISILLLVFSLSASAQVSVYSSSKPTSNTPDSFRIGVSERIGNVVSQRSLPISEISQGINVKWFGAKGDNVTNDTAAFSRAIAYIRNQQQYAILNNSNAKPKSVLFIPKGVYYLPSASFNIDFAGLTIKGEGRTNSKLRFTGSTVLFDIGVFNTTVTDLFNGTATDFRMDDLFISNMQFGYHAAGGTRVGQAIRDNGNGSVYMSNVEIVGYKYGFNAPTGSDFSEFYNCNLSYNDVGMYLGPGSQQVLIQGGVIAENVEGLVLDRAQQARILGTSLNDNINGHIIFEHFTTGTRQLASVNLTGTSEALNVGIRDCWFESGQQNTSNTEWIVFQGNTVDIYRGVEIESPHIVAGVTAAVSGVAFVNFKQTASGVSVKNATYQGAGLAYKVKGATLAGSVLLEDWYTANGYTEPPSFDATSVSTLVEVKRLTNERFPNGAVSSRIITKQNTTSGIREQVNTDASTVSYAFNNAGTWLDRFGFDVQNRKIVLGSVSNNELSIDRGTAAPTGGTFAQGSFRYNLSATATGIIGWQCVGAGSPGTWQPVYNAGKSGSSSLNGDGATTAFVVTHGLGTTPAQVIFTKTSTLPDYYISAKSSTTFTVTFATAPTTGTGNVSFDWVAK